uniref:(northern house mosquito) hypothetical protein n=1 Tax=Culex pipiens TaxID=7175 RepID=A0A8D8AFT0_CULPI
MRKHKLQRRFRFLFLKVLFLDVVLEADRFVAGCYKGIVVVVVILELLSVVISVELLDRCLVHLLLLDVVMPQSFEMFLVERFQVVHFLVVAPVVAEIFKIPGEIRRRRFLTFVTQFDPVFVV